MMIRSKLNEILGKKRMHITELQRLSGVSYSTLHRIYHDKGNNVTLSTVDKICKALEVQPGDLLEYVPDNNKGGELWEAYF